MAKWKYYNGSQWVEIGGGGGGSGHTHPNLTLLNSITQAMVTAWNSAATWVNINGANMVAHIADSLLHVPSGGTAGQVLTKTATGTAWATGGGGGGGGNLLQYIGAYSVRSSTTATFTPPTGATGLVLLVTYSSIRYAAFIPIGELTTSYTEYGISCSNTYVSVRLKNDSGTISMTRSSTSAYTITVYAI